MSALSISPSHLGIALLLPFVLFAATVHAVVTVNGAG